MRTTSWVCRRAVSLLSVLLLSAGLGAQTPNPDFQTVTEKLDKGGTFYLYTDLENVLLGTVDALEPMFMQSGDRQAMTLPSIARTIIKSLGLDTLNDFGMSVLPLDARIGRMKAYLLLKDKPAGVFELRGKEPYTLASLAYVPSDAVYCNVQNASFEKLLPVIENVVAQVAGETGTSQMRMGLDKAKEAGVDIPKILASLDDEVGAYLRLDAEKSVAIGSGEDKVKLPKPSAVILIKVKDNTLYDTLTSLIAKRGGKLSPVEIGEGVQAQTIQVPDNPFDLKPVVAVAQGWMFIASHPDELKSALSAAQQKKDIRSSTDYQALTKDLPEKVNAVTFVSPRLGKEVAGVVRQLQEKMPRQATVPLFIARQLVPSSEDYAGRASVRVNDPQGILWIAQGEVRAGRALQMVGTSAGVPILAAIAVPNFLEAQYRAKVSRVRSDQRSLATGIEAYFVDNNAYPASTDDPSKSIRKPGPGEAPVASFRMRDSEYQGSILTTPVAYITAFFPDPFAYDQQQTFGYYSTKSDKGDDGWVLFSPGPDKKFDLNWKIYDPSKPQPSPELLLYFYDPTNGTVSPGDIIRVK